MSKFYIGIMSGTSMDAIDTVLIEISNKVEIKSHLSIPFPESLHKEISELLTTPIASLAHLGYLNIAMTDVYVEAVNKLLVKENIAAAAVTAIGCHGQTIFHQPKGKHRFSTQLGSGSYLAEKTSITAVTDFRNRDMAAGGQGAPLVPAFHNEVYSSKNFSRLIINIGGIANCTWLSNNEDIQGFDIGPGNTLMDCWVKDKLGRPFDKNGEWAKSGKVSLPLLERLINDDYFKQSAPKSTGREYFNIDWLVKTANIFINNLKDEDVQATLLQLTATTIANTITSFQPDQVYLCGGGVRNGYLVKQLELLSDCRIHDINELGIPADLVEAAAFAWLAHQSVNHKNGTLSSVTGASHPVICGAIYPV